MEEQRGKVFPVKRDLLPGILSIVFGILVYFVVPNVDAFSYDPIFYRLLGLALVGGGLYITKIWPWSLQEVVLEPGKITYRHRNGREEIYRDIANIVYHHRRWGKKEVEMVSFSGKETGKGIMTTKRISTAEIHGKFTDFADQFRKFYGGK